MTQDVTMGADRVRPVVWHTYLVSGWPWSRWRCPQGEARALHCARADFCHYPKLGQMGHAIFGSGGLRSRSPPILQSKGRSIHPLKHLRGGGECKLLRSGFFDMASDVSFSCVKWELLRALKIYLPKAASGEKIAIFEVFALSLFVLCLHIVGEEDEEICLR